MEQCCQNSDTMSPCKEEDHCKAFAIHCGEEQTDYWAAMMMEEWERYSMGSVTVLCFALWWIYLMQVILATLIFC